MEDFAGLSRAGLPALPIVLTPEQDKKLIQEKKFGNFGLNGRAATEEGQPRVAKGNRSSSRDLGGEVPPEVADNVPVFSTTYVPDKDKNGLVGDLSSTTSVVEAMEPVALMAWIDEFMIAMSQAVMDFNGLILDYYGDGLMAAFGAPVPSRSEAEIRRDAENALRAARQMEAAVDELNARRQTDSAE